VTTIRIPINRYLSKIDLEQEIKDLAESYLQALDRTIPADLSVSYQVTETQIDSIDLDLPDVTINYTVIFSIPDTEPDIYPDELKQRKLRAHLDGSTLIVSLG